MTSYRSFDTKAKELGYWRVEGNSPAHEYRESFLTMTSAKTFAAELVSLGYTDVTCEAPDEWEPRA